MSERISDYRVQSAWYMNGRQHCIEFEGEHKYYWMLREMARAIDPSVVGGSREYSFIFSSKALAEVFTDNAISLPDRLLRFLRGTFQHAPQMDGNP